MAKGKSKTTASKKSSAAKKTTAPKKTAPRKKPAATAATRSAVPTAAAAEAFFGVTIKPTPTASEVHHQRKALPGFSGMLETVAKNMEACGVDLGLTGLTPDSLRAIKSSHDDGVARESLLSSLYDTAYHDRLAIDDQGMSAFGRIVDRVEHLTPDHPGLDQQFAEVIAFWKKFHPGRGKGGHDTAPEGTRPKAGS